MSPARCRAKKERRYEMELRKAELARAIHLLDQMSARVQGGYSLNEVIGAPAQYTHDLCGHPCAVNYHVICSRNLNDSCEGCPIYKEIDGE